jgi:hypothetical protein
MSKSNKKTIQKTLVDDLPGYPLYPTNEDVYPNKSLEVNLGRVVHPKEFDEEDLNEPNNEKDFNDDYSGSDLDIPGSELDDELENVGSEDEENNYYSLGGDEHNDLDEDRGE